MPGPDFKRPRRPAMLTPATAEGIIGDTDPALWAALAHSSAWALMGVGDEDFTPEALVRLRALVTESGIDTVAELWARSPAFTLPGALWRLHLLVEWCKREKPLAHALYDSGTRANTHNERELFECEPCEGTHAAKALPLESILSEAEALLRGDLSEDELEEVFTHAARALRFFAASEGRKGEWITDLNDPLAYAVTTRAQAFLATAEEFEVAAREARVGTLN